MSHEEAVHNVTGQTVSFAFFVFSCGLASVDLDLVISSDPVLSVMALPTVPKGVQFLTLSTLESGKLLHHLPSSAFTPVMFSDVVVDPGERRGFVSDVGDVQLGSIGAHQVNEGFDLSRLGLRCDVNTVHHRVGEASGHGLVVAFPGEVHIPGI